MNISDIVVYLSMVTLILRKMMDIPDTFFLIAFLFCDTEIVSRYNFTSFTKRSKGGFLCMVLLL